MHSAAMLVDTMADMTVAPLVARLVGHLVDYSADKWAAHLAVL